MKFRLILILMLQFIVAQMYAQDNLLLPKMKVYKFSDMVNGSIDVYDNMRLATFFNLTDNEELIETNNIESAFAKHITYKHFVDNKEVLFSMVKLHKYSDKSVVIQSFLQDPSIASFDENLSFLLNTNKGLVSVYERLTNEVDYPKLQYINSNGDILYETDAYRYIKRDTLVNAMVYAVNPINSANAVYGGSFVDNGDATNAVLDNERVWVSMQVKFENDSFYLESDNVYIDDFSLPNDKTTYAHPVKTYNFKRDNYFFEAVNAFYHLNEIANYVRDIGYASLVKKMPVDVHALGGADNSAYDPNNHRLMFGVGGVDDAEDGEVVTHEFTHSLSERASPATTIGNERKAMEEGICDYFAKAYSKTYNDNTATKIFSWDGFNEYWDGIPINSNRKYPQDLQQTKDGDRDMWSTPLMCAHDFIGRETMDSIILEHLYFQGPNTTMPEMAQIMLDIDSTSFGRRNYSSLKTCFVAAGFMMHGATVQPLAKDLPIKIFNSQGFASGNGDLRVSAIGNCTWHVYDCVGKLLLSGNSNTIILQPVDFETGMYFLVVNLNNKLQTLKFIKQ